MIQYFAQSHVGLVRTGNEDSYYAPGKGMGKDPQFFMCVADGLGGHNAGEIASQLAVRTLVTSMQTMEGKTPCWIIPLKPCSNCSFRPTTKFICWPAKAKSSTAWAPR
ncbi:MAG: PP2C family protein-serine/threonine phosphatase [Christensenellales bacterium]